MKSLSIYVRVTVDGVRVEWSIQRNCIAGSKWSQKLGRVVGTREEVKILNAYLDAIQGNIFALQKEFALQNKPNGQWGWQHGSQRSKMDNYKNLIGHSTLLMRMLELTLGRDGGK